MDENEIRSKIQRIVFDVLQETGNDIVILEDDVINSSFTANDAEFSETVALASLEIVSVIVEVENEFQIEISDDDMFNFRTINDLVIIVKNTSDIADNGESE